MRNTILIQAQVSEPLACIIPYGAFLVDAVTPEIALSSRELLHLNQHSAL
jgi:hypothetical protein